MVVCFRNFVLNTCKLSIKYANIRYFASKVPQTPVNKEIPKKNAMQISQSTVEQLERISLVDFANEEAIKSLEEAVQFADLISDVDTSNVEPLITTLENRELYLQDDDVNDTCRDLILKNAPKVKEFYFVAPKAGDENMMTDSNGKFLRTKSQTGRTNSGS